MINKYKIMFLILKDVYLKKNHYMKKNYKKVYSFNNLEFKEKFITRTKETTFRSYIKLSGKREGKIRIYFGKLKNNFFILYTYPNMPSENIGSRISIWDRMSIWAAPAQISGKISEENGYTIINYRITKDGETHSLYNCAILACGLIIASTIVNFFIHGIYTFEPINFIFIMIFYYTASALMYIPEIEKEALLKFLDDLQL